MRLIKVSLALLAVPILVSGCNLVGATALPAPSAQEGPHRVKVHVTGLPGKEVAVRLGLFNHRNHWLRQANVFKARLLLTDQAEAFVSFYGLPRGSYAVAAYVDSNDNARLDRWLGTIPKEPVAFSQVASFRMPPSFEQSAFDVPATQHIEVRFRD